MSIPQNAIIQVSLVFQQQGTKFTNVIHWKPNDTIGDAGESADLTALVEGCAQAFVDTMHEDVFCLGGVVSLPEDSSFGSRTITLSGFQGDVSGDPSQTTQYYIIRKYGESKSKRQRGRVLVAGFSEAWTEKNVLTASAAITAANLVNFLRDDLAIITTTVTPVVYSREDSAAVSVFKTTLDPVIRSFNGRQASLI